MQLIAGMAMDTWVANYEWNFQEENVEEAEAEIGTGVEVVAEEEEIGTVVGTLVVFQVSVAPSIESLLLVWKCTGFLTLGIYGLGVGIEGWIKIKDSYWILPFNDFGKQDYRHPPAGRI